jgi:hypothetical protein
MIALLHHPPASLNMPLSIIVSLIGIALAVKGLVTILRESRPSLTDTTPADDSHADAIEPAPAPRTPSGDLTA